MKYVDIRPINNNFQMCGRYTKATNTSMLQEVEKVFVVGSLWAQNTERRDCARDY